MTNFATAAWHMTDSLLIRTLLPIALACAIRWVWLNWIAPTNDAYIDRHVDDALNETDEAWQWVQESLDLGNDTSYDRALAEIRALPTKEAS